MRIHTARLGTPVTVTATASGNTVLYEPPSGYKVTLTYLEYSCVDDYGEVVCGIRFGSTGDIHHKSRLVSGSCVVRNFTETELETRETIYINLDSAVDVAVTAHVIIHTLERTL